MSERRNKKRNGLIGGPLIIMVAIIALWKNEGRFDYHKAAKNAKVLTDRSLSTAGKPIAYTGTLGDFTLGGRYIEAIPGYYQIREFAQIYCWERKEDSDGGTRWTKGWYTSVQRNGRNEGLQQTLRNGLFSKQTYLIDDFEVSGNNLHFVDEEKTISPRDVTLTEEAKQQGLSPQSEVLYKRNPHPTEGRLGDERITLEGVPVSKTVSYFGVIRGDKGVGKQMVVKEGFISDMIGDDGILHHLVNGDRDTALLTMKEHLQKMRWMVRIVGTIMIILGQVLFWQNLMHLLLALPFVGRFLGAGLWLFSIVTGLVIAGCVMLTSMIFHHPVVAVLAIGAMTALILFMRKARARSKKSANDYLRTAQTAQHESADHASDQATQVTDPERLNKIFKNLVKISLSDGKLSEKENNFLAHWGRSKGISDENIVALFDEAKKEKDHGLEATSYDDLHHLINLSMLDGFMSSKELKCITDFGQKLGMNIHQVHAAVKRATLGQMEAAPTA